MDGFERDRILKQPGCGDHIAHLYTDSASLIGALSRYAESALARGHAVVVIATGPHVASLQERLEAGGHDVAHLVDSGQLTCLDAETVLARIMDGREPRRSAFEGVILPVVDGTLARFPGLAAYGELVNLLWQQGNPAAADLLEEWWNELIAARGFALLCGYRACAFDGSVREGLRAVCARHTHFIPSDDEARFEEALAVAIDEAFPHADKVGIADVRASLAAASRQRAAMPRPQAELFALGELLPLVAERVLSRAREHFDRARRASRNPESLEAR